MDNWITEDLTVMETAYYFKRRAEILRSLKFSERGGKTSQATAARDRGYTAQSHSAGGCGLGDSTSSRSRVREPLMKAQDFGSAL